MLNTVPPRPRRCFSRRQLFRAKKKQGSISAAPCRHRCREDVKHSDTTAAAKTRPDKASTVAPPPPWKSSIFTIIILCADLAEPPRYTAFPAVCQVEAAMDRGQTIIQATYHAPLPSSL
ncbi:hypothetical protein BASA60_009023 [Batrachochytrium salamandrivorans]|nr:hypothetical protein BASA60_009023 [Batrachochytrium salamandrivorans]